MNIEHSKMDCNILNGEFKKNEMLELFDNLIDQQIKKLQLTQFSAWERNHQLNNDQIESQIIQLKAEKKKIEAFFVALENNSKLNVSAKLNITLN